MKNKVLAFMGSARRKRNTEEMLHLFLEEYFFEDEVEIIVLRELQFSPCISCYGCAKVLRCVLQDDLTPIYNKIADADVIVFASPVYFNSVSAISKNMIDRMQVYWSRKYLLKEKIPATKMGYALLNGGAPSHESQFTGSKLVLDHFFAAIGCKTYRSYEISDTDRHPIQREDISVRKFLQGEGDQTKRKEENIEVK